MLERIQDKILKKKIEIVLQKENTHETIILRDILQRGFTTVRDLLPKNELSLFCNSGLAKSFRNSD